MHYSIGGGPPALNDLLDMSQCYLIRSKRATENPLLSVSKQLLQHWTLSSGHPFEQGGNSPCNELPGIFMAVFQEKYFCR